MGSPLARALAAGERDTFLALVQARTLLTPGGCWLWMGCVSTTGYARVRVAGRQHGLHRLVVQVAEGRPLDSEPVHHACAVRRCVAPAHLARVTARENAAEMLARTYYLQRIARLEAALAELAPDHPALA